MKSIIKLLIKKKIKLSVAESCTGGLLASTITSVSGASKIFNLGFVTYSNQAKIKILKINKNIIKKYGAVSYECCNSMVNNLLTNCNFKKISGHGGNALIICDSVGKAYTTISDVFLRMLCILKKLHHKFYQQTPLKYGLYHLQNYLIHQ